MCYKVYSFLLFLFFLTSLRLSAQVEWFNEGEVFYYEVNTGFEFGNYGIHSMTYIKDTTINGHSLKMLRYTHKNNRIEYIYIRHEGEKVSYYSTYDKKLMLMYDFTALPGDPSPVDGYHIENTGTIEMGPAIRKTQTWRNAYQRVMVIEGIGMVGDPDFKSHYVCSPPIPFYRCTGYLDGYDYYFRCMKSEEVHFDPYDSCVDSGTEEEEDYSAIYPNPAYDVFTIKSNRIFDTYSLYDLSGKRVYHKTITPNVETVCSFDTTPSLYIVRLYNKGHIVSTAKLLILPID